MFVDMRMMQLAIADPFALGIKHFPSVGIVIPAGIWMVQRYRDAPPYVAPLDIDVFDRRGFSQRGGGESQKEQGE